MWCSNCRQDVPGSIAPGGGQYSCPRCGGAVPSSHGSVTEHPVAASGEAKPSAAESPPVSDYDEWEMEERLRHLDRVYARTPLRGPLSQSGSHQFRIDSQHTAVPREQVVIQRLPESRPSWIARLGRLGLGLGLSITVCGGCLMAWAHYGARPDLMSMGIPIAVVGQVFLLIGLVLQLDSSATRPQPTESPRPRLPIPLGDSNIRIDDGPGTSPQLQDLAARLDELSRKLDDKGDR